MVRQGKGGKDRCIPIHPLLLHELQVAPEGLFVGDGHTTVLPHVYRVPFRFVVPGATAGETSELTGNAVVRQTSDGRWYIDNLTLPEP